MKRSTAIVKNAYQRSLDVRALGAAGSERGTQTLLAPGDGIDGAVVKYVCTPPGCGSAPGMHRHNFGQILYVLSGTMVVEVEDGSRLSMESNDLAVMPAGTVHRTANESATDCVHLAIDLVGSAPPSPAGASAAVPGRSGSSDRDPQVRTVETGS